MIKALPNMLSGFRIVAAPFLLYFAWSGNKNVFLGLLIVSLLSDSIDGYISRKFNITSELGTRLDSWGDMATYLTVPVCAWWLWPKLLKQEAAYVLIAVGSYLLPIIAGVAKFRRLPSYHTWGAKAAAVIMSVAIVTLFTIENPWPFRCAAVFQALVACEEILITLRLSQLQENVKSLWHVHRAASK